MMKCEALVNIWNGMRLAHGSMLWPSLDTMSDSERKTCDRIHVLKLAIMYAVAEGVGSRCKYDKHTCTLPT